MSLYTPYQFFLNFKSDNITIEIEEPFMFNAFSHSVERKKNGFSVDVNLFAENTSLLFTDSVYSPSEKQTDIDGTVLFNLSHGLKRIIDSYNEHGPDGEIELVINFEGSLLTKCDFDLEDIDSDLKSYFKCGFIENNKISKHKIREDDVIIDLYSDKNLDGDTIAKLVPVNILLRSKSTFAESKWIKSDIFYQGAPDNKTNKIPATGAHVYSNFCKTILTSGVEDTLNPSALVTGSNTFAHTYDGTMTIVKAKTAKSEMKVVFKNNMVVHHKYNGRTGYTAFSKLQLLMMVLKEPYTPVPNPIVVWSAEVTGQATQVITVPSEIIYTHAGILNEGEMLSPYWHWTYSDDVAALDTNYNNIDNYSRIIVTDMSVEATAVETTINSVVQGLRWIDALNKSAEIISGLPVDAPRIEIGGEYYDTVISNGAGIRNISGVPFNVKAKELFDMGMMVAQDYQVTNDKILIGEYKDFFSDRLLRVFNTTPDEKFTWNTNKDYRIKAFDYKFENYEQDRQEQRTLDAVHTEVQMLLPNVKPTNTKTIKVKQILDAYKIDSLRRLGIDPETVDSSLSDDTDTVMIKVLPLASGHAETYTGLIKITTTPLGIKLYTTNFRWDKLGLAVGDAFQILSGPNANSSTIVSKIEADGLTLLRPSPLLPFNFVSSSSIIKISYLLSNVWLQSQTDQNFTSVTGVLSKETYTNLFYSKLRNIQKWLPFLATCSMRHEYKSLKISFLKSNQDLSSKLAVDATTLVEKDDILISSISSLKRVTDRKFNIGIYLKDPSDIVSIFKELNTRNVDGSIGGFYEFIDPNGEVIQGYPEKLEYIPLENKIEAECLEKYDPNNGVINLIDSDRSAFSRFVMHGVFVDIYDATGRLKYRRRRFTKIKLNGIPYIGLTAFTTDIDYYFSL
jgi:hypothetical protein